jgi:hypothetical protein
MFPIPCRISYKSDPSVPSVPSWRKLTEEEKALLDCLFKEARPASSHTTDREDANRPRAGQGSGLSCASHSVSYETALLRKNAKVF